MDFIFSVSGRAAPLMSLWANNRLLTVCFWQEEKGLQLLAIVDIIFTVLKHRFAMDFTGSVQTCCIYLDVHVR